MPLFMDVHDHVEAPDDAAAEVVHREAHGLLADQITQLQEGG